MSDAATIARIADAYAAEMDQGQWCQRVKYGQCRLRKCMVRGGWSIDSGIHSYEPATCPRWELEKALVPLRGAVA